MMNQRIYIDTRSPEFQLESLVRKYKAKRDLLKCKAKALLERDISKVLPDTDKAVVKSKGHAGTVLAEHLGGSPTDFYFRSTLLNRDEAGFPVDEAWAALDQGMSHSSVKVVLCEAVEESGSKATGQVFVSATFAKVLREELGQLKKNPNYASVIRKRRSKKKSHSKLRPNPKAADSEPKKKSSSSSESPPKASKSSGKVPKPLLFEQMYELVNKAESSSSIGVPDGVDPDHYRASYEALLDYLKTVIYQSTRDFGQAKKRYNPHRSTGTGPNMRKVREACDTLDLKVPTSGKPLDISPKELKRIWLKAATSFHPDKNIGNEDEAHRLFIKAKDAYECLVAYNHQHSVGE